MANCKRVCIEGDLPFDAGQSHRYESASCRKCGRILKPSVNEGFGMCPSEECSEVYMDQDLALHEARKEAAQIIHDALATMNMPVIGIRIGWTRQPVRTTPSKHGGILSWYAFRITGHEALSWTFFEEFMTAVKALGGRICYAKVRDTEDRSTLCDFGEKDSAFRPDASAKHGGILGVLLAQAGAA